MHNGVVRGGQGIQAFGDCQHGAEHDDRKVLLYMILSFSLRSSPRSVKDKLLAIIGQAYQAPQARPSCPRFSRTNREVPAAQLRDLVAKLLQIHPLGKIYGYGVYLPPVANFSVPS